MILLKALVVSALILYCITLLAQKINKDIIKENQCLYSLLDIKDEKVEVLFKSLLFIKTQIYLAFTSDMYKDHEEHNKILNEICEFITKLEKIKEEQDAENKQK